MSFKNCTHLVKTRLLEGTMSYKSIANDARTHFPNAQTTDKSVASIARDMRRLGLLEKKTQKVPHVEEPIKEQIEMFPIFESPEFQMSLL